MPKPQEDLDPDERVEVGNASTGGRTSMVRRTVARHGADWREVTAKELAAEAEDRERDRQARRDERDQRTAVDGPAVPAPTQTPAASAAGDQKPGSGEVKE
jgi:hypothetical protein